MRHLSDTIARLSAMAGRNQADVARAAAIPDRLTDFSDFGSNPGALRARFYRPADLAPGAALVVVLHGCTQTAAAYDHGAGWSTLADRHGFALLFPEQQRANNANLCFNWFEPGDIARGRGEALSIHQMIGTLVARHGLDRQRIFITGLSAGGAMSCAMLAAYPEVFAAGAIIAGLPYGSARTIPEAFDRMRGHGNPGEAQLQTLLTSASRHAGPWPRLSVWHGSADRTVHLSNASAIVSQWRGVHRLPDAPSREETIDGHLRQVWQGRDGTDLIETYLIGGMGHGTPIAGDGIGTPGPYMLNAGISSTLHIARFWGLADAAVAQQTGRAIAIPEMTVAIPAEADKRSPRKPSTPMAETTAPETAVGTGVRKIIEDALRSAGLMK